MKNKHRKYLMTLIFLLAVVGTTQAADRFTYSTDGSEVTDSRTGLIWRRCAEGMTWSGGTCTGTAAQYTHQEALQQAKAQTKWRLPNIKELSSIVDLNSSNPAAHLISFPKTPSDLFWSSSPNADVNVNALGYAWGVNFSDGVVDTDYRVSNNYVRLVR